MPTLHIHADESGDLKFTRGGSRHFTFAAAWTYDPAPLATEVTSLRFSHLRNGDDIERFHANQDRDWLRRQVVAKLIAFDNWSFAAIVVDKSKLHPTLQDPIRSLILGEWIATSISKLPLRRGTALSVP